MYVIGLEKLTLKTKKRNLEEDAEEEKGQSQRQNKGRKRRKNETEERRKKCEHCLFMT